ncbi:MAG: DUF4012 domain-containing protein [Candidatus Kerfeldbacteria bacterium]|nr:DUF4012 domain-containing protein [Candidatus Kerfeldbacteria bacterium]
MKWLRWQPKLIGLHFTRASRSRRRWRLWLRRGLWSLAALVTIMVVTAGYYYPKAKHALSAARQAQQLAKQLPGDLSAQRFAQAKKRVKDLQAAIDQSQQAVSQMAGLRHWPYIGRQFRTVETLLVLGDDSVEAVKALVDFADQLLSPFANRGSVTIASISRKEKGQLLADIAAHESSLRRAEQAMDRAASRLNFIPARGLIRPLANIVRPLKEQFPLLQHGLQQAVPASRILPTVLGYPEEKKYLFLLQNNTELRPGGGFIGTYGVMNVASGEIVNLTTDNSYNLETGRTLPIVPPPEPVARYLKTRNWYFRDANWSPDFPTSAQQALLLYQRAGGRRDIDGVVAITPTAITALLQLVGPITIDRLEFTAENFTDRLQQYVDVDFRQAGVSEDDRKDIIGPLTTTLVDRILSLPLADWSKLFLVLSQQLNEKQLLLSMHDPVVQSVLVDQNWAGAIASPEGGDSLLIADANLASLKTDPAIERSYEYRVRVADGRAEGWLQIRYRHTRPFDWKTTRYNTYVRIYVPDGSRLLDAQGAQLREKSNAPGPVTTSTELGKTVFAAFKSIEPKTENALTVHYQLPDHIAQFLESSHEYRLVWQKQPGLESAGLTLTVTTPGRVPIQASNLDNQARLSKDSVAFQGPLREDRAALITYRR